MGLSSLTAASPQYPEFLEVMSALKREGIPGRPPVNPNHTQIRLKRFVTTENLQPLFRPEKIDEKPPEPSLRESWLRFTDPKNHDPKRYRYLVHSFPTTFWRAKLLTELKGKGGYDPSQDIDLWETPLRIGEKKIISCSIVDQDHPVPYGTEGLILEAPLQNVLMASPQDSGTHYFDPDSVVKKGMGLDKSVEDLLRATHPREYNEVVLRGRSRYGDVRIIGFFIFIWAMPNTDLNILNASKNAQRVQFLAGHYHLPLIELIVWES